MNLMFVIFIVLILGLFLLLFLIMREISGVRRQSGENFVGAQMLNQNLQGMHKRLDDATKLLGDRLDKSHSQMLNTFDSLSKTMSIVGEELGGVKHIGHQISKFQEFLNAPKMRGNLGEHILNDSLQKILPRESFSVQHKFRSGATVDALIITNKGNIPIDSKFSLADYEKLAKIVDGNERTSAIGLFSRSAKKHIDDISCKYILPDEGTVDFALMYIPAESVYYEMVSGDNEIVSYAQEKKVILVSPNTFFHFLRVVLMGLERSKMADEAEQIWQIMTTLQHDFRKFGKKIDVLCRHITNAKNSADLITQDYSRLDSKFDNIKLLK